MSTNAQGSGNNQNQQNDQSQQQQPSPGGEANAANSSGNNQNTNVQAPATPKPGPSERFTMAVEREFTNNAGNIELTGFQKKLIKNFFIKIDMVFKKEQIKWLATPPEYRETPPYDWNYVNMQQLAYDSIAYSAVGLDPTQPNHLNPIPFFNSKSQLWDIGFIPGYRGVELRSKKYGIDVPDEVIIEVLHKNDHFKIIKRDVNNPIEGYEFEIKNPDDRGEVCGGFYYHQYFNEPRRNKVFHFSMAAIEKRIPEYASAEFWGGEKDVWAYNPDKKKREKTGEKQKVEGWLEEMVYKTVHKAAYNCITIDSMKIDEAFLQVINRERETKDLMIDKEIRENGNKTEIGFRRDIQDVEIIPESGHDQHPVEQTVQIPNPNLSQGPAPEPQKSGAPASQQPEASNAQTQGALNLDGNNNGTGRGPSF